MRINLMKIIDHKNKEVAIQRNKVTIKRINKILKIRIAQLILQGSSKSTNRANLPKRGNTKLIITKGQQKRK